MEEAENIYIFVNVFFWSIVNKMKRFFLGKKVYKKRNDLLNGEIFRYYFFNIIGYHIYSLLHKLYYG